MKKAFTLIELIFVMVIIGIMAGVGFSSFKPKYLLNDTNFIQAKIKEAQFLGIGYEHNGFNSTGGGADFKTGCVNISVESLEETAVNKNEVSYTLHVSIEKTQGEGDDSIICFDAKGRPHHTDFTLDTLLTTQTIFTFTYSNKKRYIKIEPFTGYLILGY